MAGAVREFKNVLMLDEHKAAEQRAKQEVLQHLADPMGYGGKLQLGISSGTRRVVQGRRGRK